MDAVLDPLSFPFFQRALLASALAGVVCAVVGSYVVLKGLAFIGDAVAHAAFPGVVVAYIVGGPYIIGGGIAAFATAISIGWISRRAHLRVDTAIGVVFAGAFALGIFLYSAIKGFVGDLFGFLVGSAVATGRVSLHSDGKPWRPVAHVQDVARAFLHVLEAPIARVHNQAFNNGEDRMNHQIRELADVVVRTVPGCRLECRHSPEADQRTYKTDFGKFARTFPEFAFEWTIERGAQELAEAFRSIGLTEAEFFDKHFTRLKWLRYLLDSGRLDGSLRWTTVGAASS